jgi:hypothetical protein
MDEQKTHLALTPMERELLRYLERLAKEFENFGKFYVELEQNSRNELLHRMGKLETSMLSLSQTQKALSESLQKPGKE